MRRVALLLACLACTSPACGRRITTERQRAGSFEAKADKIGSSSASGVLSLADPLKVFAQFLLARTPGVGWQVVHAVPGHGMFANKHHVHHAASSSAVMMKQSDKDRSESVHNLALPQTLDRREAVAAAAVLGSVLSSHVDVPAALAATAETDPLADFNSTAREVSQQFGVESLAPDDALEKTVSMEELTAALATAPPRDVVITGASSGVGLAGAKILTAAGHRVVCACRTKAKAEAAAKACNEYAANKTNAKRKGGLARGMMCDLSFMSDIRFFASQFQDTKIDTLVLNAGISRNTLDNRATRTGDGFEETVGVNHLGHFLLANLLVPSLEKSPKPRIVVTSSNVHDPNSALAATGRKADLGELLGLDNPDGSNFEMVSGAKYVGQKAYVDSKLCNIMFMLEGARRFAAKGITVNAFSPGLIPDPEGFYRYQFKPIATAFDKLTTSLGVTETNEFGGSALAYMSVDPALDGATGKWFDSFPSGKHQLAVHMPSEQARSVILARNLWVASAKLVGLIDTTDPRLYQRYKNYKL